MNKILLLVAVLLTGCGSGDFQMVPVSGTVTFDGEPLKGAEVVFAPMETPDNVNAGPPSVGTTDANGKYTLTSVRGQGVGVIVAEHRVSVNFKEIADSETSEKFDAAIAKKRSMPRHEVEALRRKLQQAKQDELKGQKKIPASYNKNTKLRFKVTEAADNADFNLTGDGI